MHSSVFHHKRKKKKASEEMALQITSMADVFTIILVFLLKSTATGIASVSPTGANLPVAAGSELTKDALKIEVSRDIVTVDDKGILKLVNFDVPVTEVIENGMSQSIYQALMEKRKIKKEGATPEPGKPEVNNASELLVLADENTPYSTLKTVLASAANSGFVDLQLVVVGDN